MKKNLLLLFILTVGSCLQAQVLLTEDATALSLGNIGTDLTGAVPGAGGWLTVVPVGGTNAAFQIVNQGGSYGNAFQITGSNTGTASGIRNTFKSLTSVWSGRTNGNDIAEVDFDFYTGVVSTSLNNMRVILYDAASSKMLGGIKITMNTLAVTGLSYYDNSATAGGVVGNYGFNLGVSGAVVTLSPNTWYKFGFSFNKTTGEVKFKEANGLFDIFIMGAATGVDVDMVNLIASPGTGNTVAAIGVFDNLKVKASSVDSLLDTQDIAISENKFSVYPNPAKNTINISNTDGFLNSVEMADINGRVVKTVKYSNANEVQISIADLAQGIYMMKIVSDKGTVTKKIIKE
jgi:hypothetical protein